MNPSSSTKLEEIMKFGAVISTFLPKCYLKDIFKNISTKEFLKF